MLKPKCKRCKKELKKYGAILLGPPDKDDKAKKIHLLQCPQENIMKYTKEQLLKESKQKTILAVTVGSTLVGITIASSIDAIHGITNTSILGWIIVIVFAVFGFWLGKREANSQEVE
jgi:hypothetical protein